MKKVLTVIFATICYFSYSQTVAVSDTLQNIKYVKITKTDTLRRDCFRYSPLDEDVNQNFKNLFIEKVLVGDDNYYVLLFGKTAVASYDASGYASLAYEFGRKSESMYDAGTTSSFFAMTQKQYEQLKNCLNDGTGKLVRIKSGISGVLFTGVESLKFKINSKYKIVNTFAIACDGNNVYFRLPEEYIQIKWSKRLFNTHRFECKAADFSKLIIK